MMKYSEYNEVINDNMTYDSIAYDLVINKFAVLIGWTDEKYDHRDILFSFKPRKYGYLQRGYNNCILYVSIMNTSCSGFLIESNADNRKHNNYIKEKLNLSDNSCDDKICDLINGVIYFIDRIGDQ